MKPRELSHLVRTATPREDLYPASERRRALRQSGWQRQAPAAIVPPPCPAPSPDRQLCGSEAGRPASWTPFFLPYRSAPSLLFQLLFFALGTIRVGWAGWPGSSLKRPGAGRPGWTEHCRGYLAHTSVWRSFISTIDLALHHNSSLRRAATPRLAHFFRMAGRSRLP